MTIVRYTILALAVSFPVLSLNTAHAANPRTFTAKVERISHGDTSTAITSEGTKLRLRLLGIDAPMVPHGKKRDQTPLRVRG